MNITELNSFLNSKGYRLSVRGSSDLEIEVSNLKGYKKIFLKKGLDNESFLEKIAVHYGKNNLKLF